LVVYRRQLAEEEEFAKTVVFDDVAEGNGESNDSDDGVSVTAVLVPATEV
jgi:hypothetical protein